MSEPRLASVQTIESSPSLSDRRSDLTPGKVVIHSALMLATIGSLFVSGAIWSLPTPSFTQGLQNPRVISSGIAYSLTLISILLAHEMGHYLACRYYGIRASLPYFIPAPPIIGTFGAFIRIKEPITSRRALFDIGIAGPLAGFIVAIPAAIIGLLIADPAQISPLSEATPIYEFQDPLFFIVIQKIFNLPQLIEWNPIYFAAWVGMLATSLNLLPVGQLDGGHVVYAIFGRKGHQLVAVGVFILVCVLALVAFSQYSWPGWFIYVAMLGLLLRLKHPPLEDEYNPIDSTRLTVGIIGLLVFVLSFMPFPVVVS